MWQETDQGLYRTLRFRDFKAAFAFMRRVADLAEERQHHPRWRNEYDIVEIWLISHDAGDKITPKDHDMAVAIDRLV